MKIQYKVYELAATGVAHSVDAFPVYHKLPHLSLYGQATMDDSFMDDDNLPVNQLVKGEQTEMGYVWYDYQSSDQMITVEETRMVLAELNGVPMDEIELICSYSKLPVGVNGC